VSVKASKNHRAQQRSTNSVQQFNINHLKTIRFDQGTAAKWVRDRNQICLDFKCYFGQKRTSDRLWFFNQAAGECSGPSAAISAGSHTAL
jgi:hypothetical protein